MEQIHVVTLPFNKEELSEVIDYFESKDHIFVIDLSKTVENMDTDKIMTYLSNCNIRNVILRHGENDKWEDMLLSYIKFNRPYPIIQMIQGWNSALLYNSTLKTSEATITGVQQLHQFTMDNKPIIEELDYIFYSFRQLMSNLVCPEDKELDNQIKNAENNKFSDNIGLNAATLALDDVFYEYLGSVEKDKMYVYDEFVNPVIEGESFVYHILKDSIPFKAMMCYNDYYRNPEDFEKRFNKIYNKGE